MPNCVVAFPCLWTFYASPASSVVFVENFIPLVSALFMEHKLSYDTLPYPHDSNAGTMAIM